MRCVDKFSITSNAVHGSKQGEHYEVHETRRHISGIKLQRHIQPNQDRSMVIPLVGLCESD